MKKWLVIVFRYVVLVAALLVLAHEWFEAGRLAERQRQKIAEKMADSRGE